MLPVDDDAKALVLLGAIILLKPPPLPVEPGRLILDDGGNAGFCLVDVADE